MASWRPPRELFSCLHDNLVCMWGVETFANRRKNNFELTCAENGNKRWSGRHEWECVVAVDKQLQRIALLSLGRCSNWREDLEGGQGSIPRQSQRAGQGAENTRTLSHISQGEENTQSHQSGHDEDKSEQVRADTQSHQSGHDEDKLHIILQ